MFEWMDCQFIGKQLIERTNEWMNHPYPVDFDGWSPVKVHDAWRARRGLCVTDTLCRTCCKCIYQFEVLRRRRRHGWSPWSCALHAFPPCAESGFLQNVWFPDYTNYARRYDRDKHSPRSHQECLLISDVISDSLCNACADHQHYEDLQPIPRKTPVWEF